MSHPNIFFCNVCGDRVDKELYDATIRERNALLAERNALEMKINRLLSMMAKLQDTPTESGGLQHE